MSPPAVRVVGTAPEAARVAAHLIARGLDAAIAARGRAVVACSGGSSPIPMFRALADEPVDWARVHVVQVDERLAPAGDPARNLTALAENLVAPGRLPAAHLHPMPVEAPDPDVAAERYAAGLVDLAGDPPVLDVVHLGLGDDGHTASLVPGDPVVDVVDRDVALSGVYRGHRRMTLTRPALDRARHVVWLVLGAAKRDALVRLLAGDGGIPAGRLAPAHAVVVADPPAAGRIAGR